MALIQRPLNRRGKNKKNEALISLSDFLFWLINEHHTCDGTVFPFTF
jgi:hypothetical protein